MPINWSAYELERLKHMLEKGMSSTEIGDFYGISGEAVRQTMFRHNVKRDVPLETKKGASRHINEVKRKEEPDIAKRIMALRGEFVTADDLPIFVSDDRLEQYVDDPFTFLKEVVNVDLFDYQKDMVQMMRSNRLSCFVMGRQIGKDFTSSAFAVWSAVVNPNSTILIVSPTQRQSNILFNRIHQFVFNSRELRASAIDASKEYIELSNGSQIHSLPTGVSGDTIRGFHDVNMIIANESAWIPEEVFNAVKPMLAITQGKLILMSTPFGKTGMLWRSFNNNAYAKMNLPSSANPLITKEFLEEEREHMDMLSYQCEYEAQFMELANAYFPSKLIQQCVMDYELLSFKREAENVSYSIGVDWGRVAGGDLSVVSVCETDSSVESAETYRIVHLKSFEGTPYTSVCGHIERLYNDFKPIEILADSGAGRAQIDQLREDGVPVEPFNFTISSKVELFSNLKLLMEQKKLIIPNHNKLIFELSTFEYSVTKFGNLRLSHTAGGHDDYVDSIALAVFGAKKTVSESNYGTAVSFDWGEVKSESSLPGLSGQFQRFMDEKRRRGSGGD